ncbi:MAG: glycosyltransferase family 4 protein [Streptococcaceae bacterium]|jgi:glycosyltransferase involved in cell wall biosynthesis|nr:glycosyltransferase family 4 protein [Streptococcaceae bacterium]
MKRKNILVVSQYFYPEQFRINDICQEWAKRGYKVTVLTGIPNYPQGKYYEGYHFFSVKKEKFGEIDIIRLPLIARGSNSIMLILNYFSFVVSGWFWKLFSKLNSDYVFIYEVSPVTQALPGVWFAKKKKIPCYLYMTDLWPESVEEATGVKNKFIIRNLDRMVRYIYKNCDRIFNSSKSFHEKGNEYGIDAEKMQFWPQYAEEFYQKVEPAKNEIENNGRFQITFAGNIGQSQGLEILPEVARLLEKADCGVQFNIIGDGRFKKELQKEVSDREVAHFFNFIDQKPAREIPYYFANSDVALIILRRGRLLEKVIPAKVQSCMACGMPILASASGEIQSIIKEAECGFSSEAGDVNGLFQNIKKMLSMEKQLFSKMGKNAQRYYQDHFDKKLLMDQMDEYFGEVNV